MNDEGKQVREHELGKRIASLIRSIGQGAEKPITSEEQQKLKAAADRLDQMLKNTADADRQALRDTAARLDRLLADIRKGKDVTRRISRREREEPNR